MTKQDAIVSLITNFGGLVGGVVLLSFQFGWKVGVGVGLLTLFHKNPE